MDGCLIFSPKLLFLFTEDRTTPLSWLATGVPKNTTTPLRGVVVLKAGKL